MEAPAPSRMAGDTNATFRQIKRSRHSGQIRTGASRSGSAIEMTCIIAVPWEGQIETVSRDPENFDVIVAVGLMEVYP